MIQNKPTKEYLYALVGESQEMVRDYLLIKSGKKTLTQERKRQMERAKRIHPQRNQEGESITIEQECATAYMGSGSEDFLRQNMDSCGVVDSLAMKQEIFDQMLQFGQICMVIGFVIGLTMPYAGRYLRLKYGWFTK